MNTVVEPDCHNHSWINISRNSRGQCSEAVIFNGSTFLCCCCCCYLGDLPEKVEDRGMLQCTPRLLGVEFTPCGWYLTTWRVLGKEWFYIQRLFKCSPIVCHFHKMKPFFCCCANWSMLRKEKHLQLIVLTSVDYFSVLAGLSKTSQMLNTQAGKPMRFWIGKLTVEH